MFLIYLFSLSFSLGFYFTIKTLYKIKEEAIIIIFIAINISF
jgi:hypothetical protein